jgi:glucose-1-phosphate adenylyltransferase
MGNDYFQSIQELEHYEEKNPPMAIGKRCFISDAIIDKNCRIGDDVRIQGGDHLEDGDYGSYHVVDGIVVVPKNSVIEEGTRI